MAPLTINSGDFVVGFSTSAGTFPGFTDNTTNQGRSYLPGNGTSFSTVNGNLLIRANYFTSCGASGSPPLQACVSQSMAIPDNAPLGITSNQVLTDGRTITGLTVSVNIQHTWIGDLIVELRHGTTIVRLHDRTGGGVHNIVGTYGTTLTVDGPGALADFIGQAASGTWTLFVSDNEAQDTGTLVQ